MIDPQKGAWLLPSRGRPDALRRFFAACDATAATTHGIVICDGNEEYCRIDPPSSWRIWSVPEADCFADAMKSGLSIIRSMYEPDWVGWLADDNIPETPNWDTKLVGRLKGWNVVNSDDGWQSRSDTQRGRLHGAVVWSGDLLRAVGYMFPPGLKHMFTDTVWEHLGRETGCWQTDMSVMVRHAHASLTGEEDETTRRNNSFYADDERVFAEWCRISRARAVERIFALMEEYGSKIALPDLSGHSVMIATPTGSGRYERSYMKAWRATIDLLRDCKVKVDWIEMPYCADLALSRAKLMGTFIRSSYSHLMMIDDDMGWRPWDVVRLLQAKRDFIAAAGPMRQGYPINYCVNFAAGGVQAHSGGELEAEKVGGAFVLLSRRCVEQMAAAYPDLEAVTTDNGLPDVFLFDPVFVESGGKRWRFSEDYSFCWRWRQIGGKIYVLPDVPLDHSGPHTFSGALSSVLARQGHGE